jgi:hypothetical protein
MIEALQPALIACGIVAGVGFGFAAVIRAYFEGKVAMRLVEQGEMPPQRQRLTFFSISPEASKKEP